MEIINSYDSRRTVLLVSDEFNDLTDLRHILEKTYRVAYFDNGTRDFSMVHDQSGNISVAIICARDAAADDYALFHWVNSDSMLASIPMLIYCGSPADYSVAAECIKRGAVDIITSPLIEEMIVNRIENSIRIKDSTTFFEIERMLKELPSNIMLKDDQGRYIFATHYWHLFDRKNDPEWTIRGKTDMEIRKDRENVTRAMESDRELLETGIGQDYIIEINEDDVREFLQVIKEPVRDDKGNITGIIVLVNDVTDRELLRMQLEQTALRDDLTGVRNKNAYSHEVKKLNQNIAYDDVQFGIAMIDLNYLKRINDTYGHELGNVSIVLLCRLVCLIFKHSPVFRIGGDEFVVILENSDLENIDHLVERFKQALRDFAVDETLEPWEKISAAIGVAFYDPATDNDVKDVFNRADQEMYVCKKEMHAGRI